MRPFFDQLQNIFRPDDGEQERFKIAVEGGKEDIPAGSDTSRARPNDGSRVWHMLQKLQAGDDIEHDSVRPMAGERIAALAANQFRVIRWRDSAAALQEFQEALQERVVLNDYEAEARIQRVPLCVDLISRRVLLDPPIMRSALISAASESQTNRDQENSAREAELLSKASNGARLLTYLATLLQAGTTSTPYSMVTAAGSPWTPADMRDDEVIVSQWLADDLRVKPGDELSLVNFDPESGARLVERTNSFRVRAIVPMEMPWADRTLMPDFPGIEKAESTSDWDAGFPLVHKIRQKDEDYWKQHRGTPKAFVSLAAATVRAEYPPNPKALVEKLFAAKTAAERKAGSTPSSRRVRTSKPSRRRSRPDARTPPTRRRDGSRSRSSPPTERGART